MVDGVVVKLLAPNRFVVDWVRSHCLEQIRSWWTRHSESGAEIVVEVGSRPVARREVAAPEPEARGAPAPVSALGGRLNPAFTFESFVEGKSNQLARAAAVQVG